MDTSASTIVAIPLDDLRVSPLNARSIDTKSLDEMAASILAEGLLQNLTVTEAADGMFEVVAGKRRLGALQLLRERGQLIQELQSPPCRIVTDERAVSASLAENIVREAMHPADEFEAFKRLADQGRSIEEIAAEFGVLPLVVQRRLRLANVAPALFALFRKDEIKLDQIMALAVTEDHKAQEAAWSVPHGRDAYSLKARLTKSEINIGSDRAAKYVGLDALQAAGVIVRRDLFSDRGDGYADDRLMIDQLALAKLEAQAETFRSNGWSWVEARIDFPYSDRNSFGQIYAESGKSSLTKDERARLKALEAEYQKLADADEGEVDEASYERYDQLESEIAALKQRSEVWTPAQKASAGVVVTIAYEGTVEIHAGLVRPADQKAAKSAGVDVSGGRDARAPKKPEDLSAAMLVRLTAQRTAILQEALSRNRQVALAVLAHGLLLGLCYPDRFEDSPTKIRFAGPGPLEAHASELPMMRHFSAMTEAAADLKKSLPSATKLLDWLIEAPADVVLSLLVFASSQSIDTVSGHAANPSTASMASKLAAALSVDMADAWEPTRETFLSHVPRVAIEQAVREARGEVEVTKLATMKKEQLVEAAEQLLAGKRWLPKPLRMPVSKSAAPAKSEPPAAATANKATKAKPRSKPAAKPATKKKPKAKAKR